MVFYLCLNPLFVSVTLQTFVHVLGYRHVFPDSNRLEFGKWWWRQLSRRTHVFFVTFCIQNRIKYNHIETKMEIYSLNVTNLCPRPFLFTHYLSITVLQFVCVATSNSIWTIYKNDAYKSVKFYIYFHEKCLFA